MVRLFVRHVVADFGIWKPIYEEFDEQRGAMGVTDDAVFQSLEDPNDVTLWHDFETEDEARAFVTSPEHGEAMREAGVQGEPDVWYVTPCDED